MLCQPEHPGAASCLSCKSHHPFTLAVSLFTSLFVPSQPPSIAAQHCFLQGSVVWLWVLAEARSKHALA